MSLNEASSSSIGLGLIKFLVKEISQDFTNDPGCCQDYSLISSNGWQEPIAKKQCLYSSLSLQKLSLCLHGDFTYIPTSLVQEGTLHITKGKKCKHQPSHKLLNLQSYSTSKICWCNVHTKFMGVTNLYLI